MSKKHHKAALAVIILFIISAAFLIAANCRIVRGADEIVITKAAEWGDPSYAKGLTLRSSAIGFDGIKYDETVEFDGKGETVSVTHETDSINWAEKPIYDVSVNSYILIRADILLDDALYAYLEGVAKDMEPGSSKVITVRPADFMDYYPVCAVYQPEYNGNQNTGYEAIKNSSGEVAQYLVSINEKLTKLFRVPVDSGRTADLEITRTARTDSEFSVKYAKITLASGYEGYPVQCLFTIASGCRGAGGSYYICSYTDDAKDIEGGPRVLMIPAASIKPDGRSPVSGLAVDAAAETCVLDPGYSLISAYQTLEGVLVLYAGNEESSKIWFIGGAGEAGSVAVTKALPGADKSSSRITFLKDSALLDIKGQPYVMLKPEGASVEEVHYLKNEVSERASGMAELWDDILTVNAFERDGRLYMAGKYSVPGTAIPDAILPTGRYAGFFLAIYDSEGLKYYARFSDGIGRISSNLNCFSGSSAADTEYLDLQ